ncbi:MAG: asparagine synthase (glutamine-hydrolyzing) [Planctomycetaceae bacterium]|nr:asparagine synthase (glutamine-hydrolyzing) [Planctomycetaceae bacterium]
MCGILGVIAGKGQSLTLSDDDLIAMRETMFARGPDGAGFVRIQNRAALAHRRLAIRDLTEGKQPWTSTDSRFSLVYNGELYNTDELNQKTASHFSESLKGHCDTELLMRAFQVWGTSTPEHLRGMFACGLYDTKENRLTLIRDRFGIKPLYYAWVGNEFVFASSPAAILKHPHFVPKPHWPAISHYLQTLRTTFCDKTLIEGIHQLPPGCLLQLDDAGLIIQRYWNYPTQSSPLSYSETVELFEQSFEQAVQVRMVSDVPVGMMLSGGVDSSLLGEYVKQHLGSNFVAQCGVGSGVQETEDKIHAELAAQHLGCKFRTVEVEQMEYRESWIDLIQENALPLATPSDVIIYHLASSLKKHVGVVLGGEGADELLCGYSALHGVGRDYDLLQRIRRSPENFTSEQKEQFADSYLKSYQASSFTSLATQYFSLASLIPFPGVSMLLKSGLNFEDEILAYYEHLLKQGSQDVDESSKGLAGVTHLLHRINLETLLSRLDRSTMAASLEARVPYTDHRFIENIWKTPLEHRFRVDPNSTNPFRSSSELEQQEELQTKRLLRDVASRTLPPELAHRKKASFPTSVPQWLQADWKGWTATQLQQSPFLQEYFQQQPIQELALNPEAAGMWTWPLLNLAIWGDHVFS